MAKPIEWGWVGAVSRVSTCLTGVRYKVARKLFRSVAAIPEGGCETEDNFKKITSQTISKEVIFLKLKFALLPRNSTTIGISQSLKKAAL